MGHLTPQQDTRGQTWQEYHCVNNAILIQCQKCVSVFYWSTIHFNFTHYNKWYDVLTFCAYFESLWWTVLPQGLTTTLIALFPSVSGDLTLYLHCRGDRAPRPGGNSLAGGRKGQKYVGQLPNIGAELVITTIRASLTYHWVHQGLTMGHK